MPLRITPLVNGEYYHIYNRGVASQPTYSSKKDYARFLLCFSFYRFNKLPCRLSQFLQIPIDQREQILSNLKITNRKSVELIAFCLMPNHFHILMQQRATGGISKFMKQVADSYTRYFNTKHDRSGPVFQGAFKAVHIDNDNQLIHLSRYIHLNPLVSFVVREENFLDYPWSSLRDFLDNNHDLINPQVVLGNFKSAQDYLKFVMDQKDYAKEVERIKHLSFEA